MTYYNIPSYSYYNTYSWESWSAGQAFPYYTGSQNYSLYSPSYFNSYSGWASNYASMIDSFLNSSEKPSLLGSYYDWGKYYNNNSSYSYSSSQKPSLLSSYSEWQKYNGNNTSLSFNNKPHTTKHYSYSGLQSYYTNTRKASSNLKYTPARTSFSTHVDSDKGQAMLDFGKQYVNKTQSQMRKIMQGEGYSFHNGKWCADFVSFVSGKSLGEDTLPAWYKACNRAYVPSIENAARSNGAIVAERKDGKIDVSNVKPGDLGIINWEKDNSRVDHVGYVVKIEGNKVYTLEGNTGGQVAYKVRDISLFHSFVDIG